jgi:high-affinity K+ transport system ATPase subunit B
MDNTNPNNSKRPKEVIYWIIVVTLIAIFFILLIFIITILAHTAFQSGDIYAIVVLIGILVALYFGITKTAKSKRWD